MKFLFSINDEFHAVSGDLASARRQFNELTVNMRGDHITPRSISLKTREKLELQEAFARNPNDLFNMVATALEPVVDDQPVTNALPLPQLFPDVPEQKADYSGASGFSSFGQAERSVDLTPLALPQTFPSLPGSAPQQFVQAGVQRPRSIDLGILGG